MMLSRSNNSLWRVELVTAVLLLLQCISFVDCGILNGFHKEGAPVEELLLTLERTTRQLLTEDDTNDFSAWPRGNVRDASPKIEPTELSFMIMMDEFGYSNGITTIDEITIGTKFAFTGRIITRAEELGKASGTCTVTSAVEKELSYCQIYHRVDTDNFGGYGTVMTSGSTDEIGGRLLVTGTGGSLETMTMGYASVQFDPAGNPVIYVLLKLF